MPKVYAYGLQYKLKKLKNICHARVNAVNADQLHCE